MPNFKEMKSIGIHTINERVDAMTLQNIEVEVFEDSVQNIRYQVNWKHREYRTTDGINCGDWTKF